MLDVQKRANSPAANMRGKSSANDNIYAEESVLKKIPLWRSLQFFVRDHFLSSLFDVVLFGVLEAAFELSPDAPCGN